MDIKEFSSKLREQNVCVINDSSNNIALIFDYEPYLIDVNAQGNVCITFIDRNAKNIIKYANKKFVSIRSSYYGFFDAPLVVNDKLNTMYFPNNKLIKAFNLSQIAENGVDSIFTEKERTTWASVLKPILNDIFEIFNSLNTEFAESPIRE